jgi:hypothetical protein
LVVSQVQNPSLPRVGAVVAIAADDFRPAQLRLIEICESHIAEQSTLEEEMNENIEVAKRNHWRCAGYRKAAASARKLVTFYRSVKTALEAGFMVMPNLDCDVFAVRVLDRTACALPSDSTRSWGWPNPGNVTAEPGLATGDGEYVSDLPATDRRSQTRKTEHGDRTEYRVIPTGTRNVDAPLILARPALLKAAERAMALRIFDEIGIVGATRRPRNADPLLVGRILDPVRHGVRTFFLAWWLDPRSL